MSNQQFYRSSPLSKPFYLHQPQPQFKYPNPQTTQKLTQLQNKSKFFQGQLAPLLLQNTTLKSQLTEVQKLLQNSTEMLRNLLPVPSSPERRLQLQLANIQGVSSLIRQDWLEMKENIAGCREELGRKNLRVQQLQNQIKAEIYRHGLEVRELQAEHDRNMQKLQHEKDSIISNLNLSISELKREVEQKSALAAYKQKQLSQINAIHKAQLNELKNTIAAREHKIKNLHEELSHNLREYEANKKLLIEHQQQIAAEKEKQLRESYECVLKMREEETAKNIKQLTDYAASLQDKITAKQAQILQLYQINSKYIAEKEQLVSEQSRLKQELYSTKEQSYKFSQEIAVKQESIQNLQKQISSGKQFQEKLKNKIEGLKSQISTITKQREQLQERHKYELKIKQDQIADKENTINRSMQQIANKQTLIKTLQTEIKSKQTQIEAAQKFQQLCNSLQKVIQQHKNKQEEYNKTIQQCLDKIKTKQKQIEGLLVEKSENEAKMEERLAMKMKEILDESMKRERLAQERHRDYLEQIKQEQIRKDKQYGEYLKSVQTQLNKKITDLERIAEISKKECQKLTAEMAQLDSNYRSQIQKIEAEHIHQIQQKQKKYQQEMHASRNLMTEKQNQFATVLKNKEKQHKQQMQMRKKEYDSKLTALEKNIESLKVSTGTAEIENKYKSMMSKLRNETDKEKQMVRAEKVRELESAKQIYQKMLKDQQNRSRKEIKDLKDIQDRKISQIQSQSNQQLTSLKKNLQATITELSVQLNSQKQSHDSLKASKQQQITALKISKQHEITLLNSQVLQLKNEGERKDTQITELQFMLGKKIKQMEKIDQLVAEKLKKKRQEYQLHMETVKNECEKIISRNNNQCAMKIKQVENQRLRFSTSLYNDFKDIKSKYERELNSIVRKYDELQRLFQERPSREEDLKKINELIMVKQKMDIQVKQFQKKIINANQIVKYLNLQLQNYKDMYDIFGSDGIDPLTAEKKREEFQNYIRNHIIQLAQSKSKKEEDKSKVGNIRRMMKQRQWRIRTQQSKNNSELSRDTIFNQSTMNMMQQVEEEDQSDRGEGEELLQFKKGRYVKVYRKKKVNRSQSYYQKEPRQRQIKQIKKAEINSNTTTNELRSNAQLFLSLIHKSQKSVVQPIKNHQKQYSKMSIKRRTQSTMQKIEMKQRQGEKRYQLKDRIVTIQH